MYKKTAKLLIVLSLIGFDAKAENLPPEALESLKRAEQTGDAYILEAVKAKILSDYPQKSTSEEKPTPIVASAPKPTEKPWWQSEDGEIEASANFSFGNSEQKEYFLKTSADHKWGDIENTIAFELKSSEEEGVRNKEEYRITNQTRQNVDDRNYNFLELEAEKDRFSGIDTRLSEFLGRGHVFIKEDDMLWKGEAAAGLTQTKFSDKTESNSPSGRLASHFNWDINPRITYKNVTKSTVTQEQIFTEFNNSVETKLNEVLSLRASVDVDHDTEVPAGTKDTDIETRIGVVYDF